MGVLGWILLYAAAGVYVAWRIIRHEAKRGEPMGDDDVAGVMFVSIVGWPIVLLVIGLACVAKNARETGERERGK